MRLVLEIPAESASEGDGWRYVLLDGEGLSLRHDVCTLSLLPAAQEVVLVLPTGRCAWHRVQLPKAPIARMRAALDGVLEDQLLDDLSQTHLALMNVQPDGLSTAPGVGRANQPASNLGTSRWVVACDKQWLLGHVRAVQKQRRINQITTPKAPSANAWAHVYGDEQHPQVAFCDAAGSWTLPLTDAVQCKLLPNAESFAISAEPHLVSATESLVDRHVALRSWFDNLAACGQTGHLSAGNVAQFDLGEVTASGWGQRARQLGAELVMAPRWRALRFGFLALVAVNVFGVQALAFQQHRVLAAKRQAINDLLKQTFPAVQVVVDAPAQMQRQLDVLRQARGALGPADLEALLGAWALATPLPATPADTPFGYAYANQQLKISGVKVSPESMGRLEAQLKSVGVDLNVDANHATLQASRRP